VHGYSTGVIVLALKPFIVLDDTSAMVLGYSVDMILTGEDLG
jgi:hypothetical protein